MRRPARGIPVFMETSDRGLFDVERFDAEPARALFHGLLGEVDPISLRGLSTHDKAPHVMRILQTADLSPRMAASMVEIDRTVSTWPQLGGDVQLGGATVAARSGDSGAARLPSGRVRIDLENALDGLGGGLDDTTGVGAGRDRRRPHRARPGELPWTRSCMPLPWHRPAEQPAVGRGRHRGGDRYPPGGGAIIGNGRRLPRQLCRHRRRSVQRPGRRSAARDARLDRRIPGGLESDLVVSIELGAGRRSGAGRLYPAMIKRITNRNVGRRRELPGGNRRPPGGRGQRGGLACR